MSEAGAPDTGTGLDLPRIIQKHLIAGRVAEDHLIAARPLDI